LVLIVEMKVGMKLKAMFRGDIEEDTIAGEQDPFVYGYERGDDGSLRKNNPGGDVVRGVEFVTGGLVRVILLSFVIGVYIRMSADDSGVACLGSTRGFSEVGRPVNRQAKLQDQQEDRQNVDPLVGESHECAPRCEKINEKPVAKYLTK
jgi:hypothetical protein